MTAQEPVVQRPPLSAPTSFERAAAVLAYAFPLAWLGLVVPFLIWLWSKKRTQFVRWHAAQAFNLLITASLAGLALTLMCLPFLFRWPDLGDVITAVPLVVLLVWYVVQALRAVLGAALGRFPGVPWLVPILR